MSTSYVPARWPSATATAGLWALAAASLVFWGLRLTTPSVSIAPPAAPSGGEVAVDPVAVGQMLGVVNAPAAVVATPDAASRFVLLGVVADTDQQGAALISVDGKPARPFKVGVKVADGFVLQSLDRRAASLGASLDAPSAFTLKLPVPPLATMGAAQPSVPMRPPVMAPAAPGVAPAGPVYGPTMPGMPPGMPPVAAPGVPG